MRAESPPVAPCPACGTDGAAPLRVAWPVPTWRCPACGSGFVWPLPTEEELEGRYRREHEEGKWEAFFQEVPSEEWARRVRFLNQLADGRGRVLDVGCGDGTFLAAAAEEGWEPFGTEIGPEAARLALARLGRSRIVVGSVAAMRPGAGFDAATFWDVLEHVPDPLGVLAEAVARLGPGGVVVATMPNAAGVTARVHGPRWKYYDLETYGHLTHFSRKGLDALFRRAGLEEIMARTAGSVDLRHVPRIRWGWQTTGAAAAALDRLSGLVARVAVPLGRGNTLIVSGRKP